MKAMATKGELDGRELWGACLGIPYDPSAPLQHVVEFQLRKRQLDAHNTLASYTPPNKANIISKR